MTATAERTKPRPGRGTEEGTRRDVVSEEGARAHERVCVGEADSRCSAVSSGAAAPPSPFETARAASSMAFASAASRSSRSRRVL